VEAVREIEDQRYGDDGYDDEQLCHISFPSGTGGWWPEHLLTTLEPSRQCEQ
jgi:hypothetical protein